MRKYELYQENELLQLLSQDDELAFTELYNRYWQKLFAVAYNRLKEVDSAEDIVHDVFASLWHNRKAVEVKALENYLATAAKYIVLARVKKKMRERRYLSMNPPEQPAKEPYPEEAAHYKHLLELVNKEVEKLPERCRLIFKYSRDQGLPVKEIAKRLDVSPKTVENQLNKALKRLRFVVKNLHSLFVTLLMLEFLSC